VKLDLVLVAETDSQWENALAVLKKDFPHVISCALDNTYGMILYSKFTITDHKICFAIEKDIPSFELTVQLTSGQKIDIYTAHPKPPTPTENESSTERDGELLQIAKKVKARNKPTLVMGDLNDVAWSHTTRLFTRVSGLLDPRIGRGMFNTFHAKIPVMRFPLDHVFSSHHFTLGEMKRLPFCNSDHFPIFIELFYEPTEEAKENQTLADADDVQEANEKINDAKS
jgi:endonuclease/exonuclease/phosphatase (EEP) superfamily protein YafD